MSIPQLQLLLRFLLELIGLFSYAVWGWSLDDGWLRHLYAGAIPAVVMAVWGTFNVPGDESRSGGAPVAVSGKTRLLLECAVFTGAGYAMAATGRAGFAALFLSVTFIHYMMTMQRVKWLWRQPARLPDKV